MGAAADFHANEARRKIYEELGDLVAAPLFLENNLAVLANTVQLEEIFLPGRFGVISVSVQIVAV